MFFLVKTSLHMLTALWMVLKLMLQFTRWKRSLKHCFDRKKESAKPMRKPYLIAVVAMLAAVAGALAAVAVYLRRREQELDEYERLLFGEDDALEAIAEKAMEKHTGARALRAVLEEYMQDIMYEIPKDDNIGRVTITRAYIDKTGGPVIDMRGVMRLGVQA